MVDVMVILSQIYQHWIKFRRESGDTRAVLRLWDEISKEDSVKGDLTLDQYSQ